MKVTRNTFEKGCQGLWTVAPISLRAAFRNVKPLKISKPRTVQTGNTSKLETFEHKPQKLFDPFF